MIKLTFESKDDLESHRKFLAKIDNIELNYGSPNDGDFFFPKGSTINAFALRSLLKNPADIYRYSIQSSVGHSGYNYSTYDAEVIVGPGNIVSEYIDVPLYSIIDIMVPHIFQLQLINQCNRTCKWCPAYHRRPTKPEYMSITTLSKICDIIESHGTGRIDSIHLAHISEATWDLDHFYKCTKYIKTRLPSVKTSLVTNGDWFRSASEEERIRVLKYIDNVGINDYDGDMVAAQATTSLMMKHCDSRGGAANRRGGRVDPQCSIAKRYISFDANGDILPCCKVSKLVPEQADYVLGNVNDYTTWMEVGELLDNFNLIDGCKHCVETTQQLRVTWKPGELPSYYPGNSMDRFPESDIIPITEL